MSRADPKISPPVLLNVGKFSSDHKENAQKIINRKQHFKAETLFRKSIKKNILRMRKLWNAWQHSNKQSWVVGNDARNLTQSPYVGKGVLNTSAEVKFPKNSVGMVITSPPYLNAQRYTRSTKLELWWLDLLENTSEALNNYDKGLVGTEKISFHDYSELKLVNNTLADTFIEKVYATNPLKAGIITRYFNDMRESLKEIHRVLKPGGYCTLVVGNNLVSKQALPNNVILAEIAQDEGLILRAMLVDEIRSRGLITKRHDTAGIISDEWVLLLQKPTKNNM
jgi:hypothetical protein